MQDSKRKPLGSYFLKLVERMRRLAARRRSVVVFGPTGVGKELLMNAYTESWPNEKATIVNCAAFSPLLLDSELFGHAKGAFTGAVKDKLGLVAKYDCIALDEIGDASPDMQAKILRVVQSGEYQVVGEESPRKKEGLVFIAATNKSGALRPDLLWRFKAQIDVPGLSERRADLVDIMPSIAVDEGAQGITERCLGFLLEEYDWPGNVREVQLRFGEAVEQAVGNPLDLHHFPFHYGSRFGRWANASEPGPTWKFDRSFTHHAKSRFEMQQVPGMDDEDVQGALARLGHLARERSTSTESPEEAFYREVPRALRRLVDAAMGASKTVEKDLRQAPTWKEAATIARQLWYEARIDEGMNHEQIARRLGVTPQSLSKQLKKYSIVSRRSARGTRGRKVPTSSAGLAAKRRGQ